MFSVTLYFCRADFGQRLSGTFSEHLSPGKAKLLAKGHLCSLKNWSALGCSELQTSKPCIEGRPTAFLSHCSGDLWNQIFTMHNTGRKALMIDAD